MKKTSIGKRGMRHTARILAFQTLYRYEITGEEIDKLLDFSWVEERDRNKITQEVKNFAHLLILGTLDMLEEIDATISSAIEHWEMNRVSKVDLANLRLGVYGLFYMEDVPTGVVIDEGVEIAREYGSKQSYRFINGVLDHIAKNKREEK